MKDFLLAFGCGYCIGLATWAAAVLVRRVVGRKPVTDYMICPACLNSGEDCLWCGGVGRVRYECMNISGQPRTDMESANMLRLARQWKRERERMQQAINKALRDAESGEGWGPDVTVCAALRKSLPNPSRLPTSTAAVEVRQDAVVGKGIP